MTPRVLPFLAAFAVASLACVARSPDRTAIVEEPPTPQSTEMQRIALPQKADDKPVIVSLKLRNETLRVTATGAGPRFLVERSDGVVTARGLGESELREQHPELWDAYQSGYASSEPYLDATRGGQKAQKPFVDSRLEP